MTTEEIIETINSSLADEFELTKEALKPEATLFEDLELDSLDIVDLVILLENSFKFRIREDPALREIRTLSDIHNYVINKKKELAK
jgi:acyl carrier protein